MCPDRPGTDFSEYVNRNYSEVVQNVCQDLIRYGR